MDIDKITLIVNSNKTAFLDDVVQLVKNYQDMNLSVDIQYSYVNNEHHAFIIARAYRFKE